MPFKLDFTANNRSQSNLDQTTRPAHPHLLFNAKQKASGGESMAVGIRWKLIYNRSQIVLDTDRDLIANTVHYARQVSQKDVGIATCVDSECQKTAISCHDIMIKIVVQCCVQDEPVTCKPCQKIRTVERY